MDGYLEADYGGYLYANGGRKQTSVAYKPPTEAEYQLLLKELKDFGAQAIGLTVQSGIIRQAEELSGWLKQHIDTPIIWGGPGPTLEPEKCLQHADILCINEGEEVIVELADRLEAGQAYDDIAGTQVKHNGEVKDNGNRPLLSLDNIKMPLWDRSITCRINDGSVERNYHPETIGEDYFIMTQRGCPFSCSFCIESRYQEMFGKKDSLRRRDVQLVLDELKWAKENLNVRSVLFYDDVFTVNPRWLKEFLPRYKEEIDLPYWCYTYPTTHTRELLQLLKDTGCSSITMGVQSGSERMLKEFYNRPTKTSRVIEAAQEIIDVGIVGWFDMITKSEFETEADLRATFDFLLDLPREMNTFWYGEMVSFPTYSYDAQLLASDGNQRPHDEVYEYYHKLFRCTRKPFFSRADLEQLGSDPKYREDHSQLDQFLSREKKQGPASMAYV